MERRGAFGAFKLRWWVGAGTHCTGADRVPLLERVSLHVLSEDVVHPQVADIVMHHTDAQAMQNSERRPWPRRQGVCDPKLRLAAFPPHVRLLLAAEVCPCANNQLRAAAVMALLQLAASGLAFLPTFAVPRRPATVVHALPAVGVLLAVRDLLAGGIVPGCSRWAGQRPRSMPCSL